MRVATTVDGVPVVAEESGEDGGLWGAGGALVRGGAGSFGLRGAAGGGAAAGAAAASRDVPRTLALFSYLQLKEAGGVLWIHRDVSVSFGDELRKMCGV